MESSVSFRMHHGTQPEKIPFVGNGIRVLDLKREILERKKISGSLDFDLKIVDESGRGMLIINFSSLLFININCRANDMVVVVCSYFSIFFFILARYYGRCYDSTTTTTTTTIG